MTTPFDAVRSAISAFNKPKGINIISTYDYMAPTPAQIANMNKLREAYAALDTLVRNMTTSYREKALALTNLEQSAMWANKAVSRKDDDRED